MTWGLVLPSTCSLLSRMKERDPAMWGKLVPCMRRIEARRAPGRGRRLSLAAWVHV